MENNQISDFEVMAINDMAGYLSYLPCFTGWALSHCDAKIILLDTGNQDGKTSGIINDYIRRIEGTHPIEWKNMRPDTPIRTIRFCSERLPTDSDEDSEKKNTVYPQLKKFMPASWILSDITLRNPVMKIRDPQGGPPVYIEFTSYNQQTQSQAGAQRFSVFEDEESPRGFHEEQIPRLIAAASSGHGGDILIGVTPAERITWIFEDIYEQARIIYNSPTIIDFLKKKEGIVHPIIEYPIGKKRDIAVIRAASDDNPTLTKKAIEELFDNIIDEDVYEVRRYGVFHQITGAIFKEIGPMHIISGEKYFPEGVPYQWIHARGIDFHEFVPWACGWISLSDTNEAFIWKEYNPSPERLVTLKISTEIAKKSLDYHYTLDLIDPRAAIKQPSSGISTIEDMNRIFRELKKQKIGDGAYWQSWDTKSQKGRDAIKERLMNSRLVGRPYNNSILKDGRRIFLPTLWILDSCPLIIESFRKWKKEDWANRDSEITKDIKDKAQVRYSHFPVTFECIFKHPSFSMARFRDSITPVRECPYKGVAARY